MEKRGLLIFLFLLLMFYLIYNQKSDSGMVVVQDDECENKETYQNCLDRCEQNKQGCLANAYADYQICLGAANQILNQCINSCNSCNPSCTGLGIDPVTCNQLCQQYCNSLNCLGNFQNNQQICENGYQNLVDECDTMFEDCGEMCKSLFCYPGGINCNFYGFPELGGFDLSEYCSTELLCNDPGQYCNKKECKCEPIEYGGV